MSRTVRILLAALVSRPLCRVKRSCPPKRRAARCTITLMRDAAEMPDEVIKKFEQENEGINVNIVENDPAKLMTMIAGGTAPDIFRINGIGSPTGSRKVFCWTSRKTSRNRPT